MPYAYYARLRPAQQAIYRASDRVGALPLPTPGDLAPNLEALQQALSLDARARVQRAAQALCDGVLAQLGRAPIHVTVLATRPSHGWGELHGEYQPADRGVLPQIRVWMRTAHHQRVVAYRTFLRTLLHELSHHLDYALLGLADSFHTEGFFKRESSLFKQLTDARDAQTARDC